MHVNQAVGNDFVSTATLAESEKGSSPTRRRSAGSALVSIILGLIRVTSPYRAARAMGLKNNSRTRTVIRVAGTRDLLVGTALLLRPRSPLSIWAKVAADVLDVALLAVAVTRQRAHRSSLAAAIGMTATDAFFASRSTAATDMHKPPSLTHVVRTVTINRSPEEVYNFWRDLENLPRFMKHLESVTVSNGRSTWRAKGPAGTTIEWQADIVQDRPNECIGWRSVEGATVPNRGVVRFKPAPGGRGTQVLVELKYDPPGGKLGTLVARLFGEEPSIQIHGDLRRLKQILETGEVVHSDASIHRGLHPARPSRKPVLHRKAG